MVPLAAYRADSARTLRRRICRAELYRWGLAMNDRIKEIRERLLAIENDEYMLLSDEMLDVKFLLGEIERLRAVRERFKFYGTTGCNECEDGRVTLFVANEKCISCSPSSYEKESVITNYGILTAQLMKVAHEALEFYAKGFTSFENVEENAKPPGYKAREALAEIKKLEGLWRK